MHLSYPFSHGLCFLVIHIVLSVRMAHVNTLSSIEQTCLYEPISPECIQEKMIIISWISTLGRSLKWLCTKEAPLSKTNKKLKSSQPKCFSILLLNLEAETPWAAATHWWKKIASLEFCTLPTSWFQCFQIPSLQSEHGAVRIVLFPDCFFMFFHSRQQFLFTSFPWPWKITMFIKVSICCLCDSTIEMP